jgi:hypothetical protein
MVSKQKDLLPLLLLIIYSPQTAPFYTPGSSQNNPALPPAEQNCDPGEYLQELVLGGSTQCEKCPPGKYSTATAASQKSLIPTPHACHDCEAGTFQWQIGATSCHACGARQFQAETGQTSCPECPLGTFPMMSTHCVATCPANSYLAFEAASFPALPSWACRDCLEGRYQPLTGQKACVAASSPRNPTAAPDGIQPEKQLVCSKGGKIHFPAQTVPLEHCAASASLSERACPTR